MTGVTGLCHAAGMAALESFFEDTAASLLRARLLTRMSTVCIMAQDFVDDQILTKSYFPCSLQIKVYVILFC